MSRGHATRSWLVVIIFSYILRGLCASNLLTVLVHHPEWDVSANSVSLYQLGQITPELQLGIWGGRRQGAGVSSHVGHRHLPGILCGNAGSLQQQSSWRNFSIGSNSGCIGAWRVGGVSQWWLNRPRGSFLRVSGQWVSLDTHRLTFFWSSLI